jgi:hypothetical protein
MLMTKYLANVALTTVIIALFGCTTIGDRYQKEAEESFKYYQEVWSKSSAIRPETLRQAELKILIAKPLPAVYRAVKLVFSNVDIWSDNPSGATSGAKLIRYFDNEPIFHDRKLIDYSGEEDSWLSGGQDKHWFNINKLMVIVFIESQGPNETMVYYYPLNRLCYKIPGNLQGVVVANMKFRGHRFFYRLECQAMSDQKWNWVTR